jgi:hypothetical protein
VLAPVAGPPYPSEPFVVLAGVLLIGWVLGVIGVYDAGALVHLLLAGAILAGAAVIITGAK